MNGLSAAAVSRFGVERQKCISSQPHCRPSGSPLPQPTYAGILEAVGAHQMANCFESERTDVYIELLREILRIPPPPPPPPNQDDASPSFWVLRNLSPSTFPGSRLLLRRCYRILTEKIIDEFKQNPSGLGIILTGTPGIGKSTMALFLIRTLCTSDLDPPFSYILYTSTQEDRMNFLWCRQTNDWNQITDVEAKSYQENPAKKAFVVADSIPFGHFPPFAPYVLITSPSPGLYDWSLANRPTLKWYMPPFDLAEMRSLAPPHFQEGTLTHLNGILDRFFQVWGGVGRPFTALFLVREAFWERTLQGYIDAVSSRVSNLKELPHDEGQISPTLHHLFHLIPTDPDDPTQVQIRFPSDTIRNMVLEHLKSNHLAALTDYALNDRLGRQHAKMRGDAFETVCHERFPTFEGAAVARPLGLKSTPEPKKLSPKMVRFHRCSPFPFVQVEAVTGHPDEYCHPFKPNLAAVDAVIPDRGLLFQYTISNEHPIHFNDEFVRLFRLLPHHELDTARNALCDMIFVVPRALDGNFFQQTVTGAPADITVRQYVLFFEDLVSAIGSGSAPCDRGGDPPWVPIG
ncbi:hypothetical protein PAPYR_7901 [Paratrimastix pyriformis]|uniref:Uncharacterized protein n=1 Tax=Paratrimastix pyriformis TaxID=342808 RepID=A0ABQ8UBV7_9EUKA|nr:hypothetical protein PAPYR_7901 [Paratrimastix pyriformis]